MITSTLFRSVLSTLLVSLSIFSFAFVANAETYVPPSGPPPNFNADPPIHTGSTGQAKYILEEMQAYTIGALGFLSEFLVTFDVISENLSARENGVLATAFCLGVSGDIENAEDNPGTWLDNPLFDCITAEEGWGGGGGETSLPDGSLWNQLLWWDTALSEWIPLPGSYITSNGNLVSMIFGDLDNNSPQPSYNLQIRGAATLQADDTVNNNADHLINVANQGILIQSDETELRLVDGAPQPIGAVPVTVDTNGTLEWLSIAELGSFPEGTSTGQILYWNHVDGTWNISSDGSGYLPGLGFAANYDSGQRFKYFDPNDECPKYQVIISKLAGGGFKDLDCTNELRVDYDQSKVFVESLSHDFDSRVVCARGEGDLHLCDNLSTGTWVQDEPGMHEFEVPFGVYEITVSIVGGGGGGGGGGMGRSLDLIGNQYADSILAGGAGGGGGGSGEFIQQTVDVEPGQIYTAIVGGGGGGGCAERYAPNVWWWLGVDSPCITGQVSWNPNGNAPHNGDGADGNQSIFNCAPDNECNPINLMADGGEGGQNGSTLWGNFSADMFAFLTPQGGDSGGDGTDGLNGGLYYNLMSGEIPEGVVESCQGIQDGVDGLGYRIIKYGGAGGTGGGGSVGGTGGPELYLSDALMCLPYSIHSAGHGQKGQDGPDGTGHGGGGGGGGNSQHPGDDIDVEELTYETGFGYGGRGGHGADGSVVIEW